MKSKNVTGSTKVKFWVKKQKRCNFYHPFYLSPEELISTDQSVQMYLTVFGFCQTLIFTLYNVCSVHRGDTMSTTGGYHEYIGGIP